MSFEVIAIALERSLATLTGFNPPLIALDPPPGDAGEAELGDSQRYAGASRLDEEGALPPRLIEVVADGPKRCRPPAVKQTAYFPFGCK
jgi:hypothetical protein